MAGIFRYPTMDSAPQNPAKPPPVVELALRRPYTFIVMAILIPLATPFVLRCMSPW